MDYKQKYLKYKKKYLELKKTQGKYLGLPLPDEIELNIIAQSSDEDQLWRFRNLGLRALNRYESGVYEIFGDLRGAMSIGHVLAVNTVNPRDPNPVQYRLMDVFRIRYLVIENNEQFALFNEYIQNDDISPSEIEVRNRFLRDIRGLHFGYFFNQDLGNSLNMLTNLDSLTFGFYFNRPLGDSLNSLINLRSLTFDTFFNQPLGDSLNNLPSLKSLTFGEEFNQPLGDSLNSLINLDSLTFGERFDQPLGDSLNSLINLNSLTFDLYFSQPLGDSLNNLTNLRRLKLPDSYEHELNEHLTSIRV